MIWARSITFAVRVVGLAACGEDGTVGMEGPRGEKGATGEAGAAGAPGPAGAQGPIGPVGPTGPQGPQGVAGPAGAAGAVGPAGLQGPAGPQGLIGPQGPVGVQGPAGPAGLQGPQGPEGAMMACAAGQTLVYGNNAWTCSNAIADLAYGRSIARPGTSCNNIKTVAPWSGDGPYYIDPDGNGGIQPLRVLCDMTRDGGGWTFIVKNRYQSGISGRNGGFGTLDDLDYHQSDFYKLPDATINAIIGDGTFDLMGDQMGYNSAYSGGNHEYAIVRNYSATFTFTALVPESTTPTVFESYRSSDNLLNWRGRLTCGNVGGVGINCLDVQVTGQPVGTPNPQGGAGCLFPLGSTNAGWHHVYMSDTNSDTYLYLCNGAQHSSGHDMSHRWWVR